MKKISLVLSFRNQHELFKGMLESLFNTAYEIKSLEIIPVIDDDDSETIEKIECYKTKYSELNFNFIITKRSRWFIRDYYNVGERKSSGRFVMNISADSLFTTKNWDKIIYESMDESSKKFGDDILYGMIDDGLSFSEKEGFSCWALSSKEYINLTGGMMPKEIPMWGADIELGKIFDLIDEGKRKISLRHIKIDQRSYHCDESIAKTESNRRFEEMVGKFPAFLTEDQRKQYSDKVNEYIKKRLCICGIRH